MRRCWKKRSESLLLALRVHDSILGLAWLNLAGRQLLCDGNCAVTILRVSSNGSNLRKFSYRIRLELAGIGQHARIQENRLKAPARVAI